MSNTSKTSYNSKFREDAYYGNMAEQIGPLAENNRINGKQPQGVPQESPTIVEMQALPDGGCVCDVAKLDFSLVTQEQAQAAPWALKGEGGGSEGGEGGEGGSPAQQRSLPEMMSDLTEDEIAASPFAAKTELSEFAYVGHNHDDVYALKEHNHDDAYEAKTHATSQFGTLFEYLNLTTDGTTRINYRDREGQPPVYPAAWPRVEYTTPEGESKSRVLSIYERFLDVEELCDSVVNTMVESGIADTDESGRPIPKGGSGGGGGSLAYAPFSLVVSDMRSWPSESTGGQPPQSIPVQLLISRLDTRVSSLENRMTSVQTTLQSVQSSLQAVQTSISDENAPWVRKTNFAEAMAGFIEQHQNDPATLNQTIAALTDLVASLQNVATAAQA